MVANTLQSISILYKGKLPNHPAKQLESNPSKGALLPHYSPASISSRWLMFKVQTLKLSIIGGDKMEPETEASANSPHTQNFCLGYKLVVGYHGCHCFT